jgi:hypothetical protein
MLLQRSCGCIAPVFGGAASSPVSVASSTGRLICFAKSSRRLPTTQKILSGVRARTRTLFLSSNQLNSAPRELESAWMSKEKPRARPTTSLGWLSIYFGLNLALTIYNKLVLAGGFPFPYTLTAIHCLFGTAGSYFCLQSGGFVQAKLSFEETLLIFLFSLLYAVNIIVSNVSL